MASTAVLKHNEAFSFQIATEQETDRYWDAIVGNGGQESTCGWLQGQVGRLMANRAFEAMMGMKKIDVAAIKAARRG